MFLRIGVILGFAISAFGQTTTTYTISTVFGPGPVATGATATNQAMLPAGIALDAAGNLYVADKAHFRIWKVTPAGAISAFAGTGHYGYSGDGGPAITAHLGWLNGLAFDPHGNLYFADSTSDPTLITFRVRRIDTTGIITTIADQVPRTQATTNLAPGIEFGMAADDAGNVYIADGAIRRIAPSGTVSIVAQPNGTDSGCDNCPVAQAHFSYLFGVALDRSGNIYVPDYGYYRVRKITPSGMVQTVGTAYDGLQFLNGIALDQSGNIYSSFFTKDNKTGAIATTGIARISANGAGTTMTATSDCATPARLTIGSAGYLATDSQGTLYFTDNPSLFDADDNFQQRVRKWSMGTVCTVAGGSPWPTSANPPTIGQIANSISMFAGSLGMDGSGNFYLGDDLGMQPSHLSGPGTLNFTNLLNYTLLLQIGPDGQYRTRLQSQDFSTFLHPDGFAVDSKGYYYTNCLTKQFCRTDPSGNRVIVAGSGSHGTGGSSGDGGSSASAVFDSPNALAVNPAGTRLLIGDDQVAPETGAIREVNLSTATIDTLTTLDHYIAHLAVDANYPNGNAYALLVSGDLYRISSTGKAVRMASLGIDACPVSAYPVPLCTALGGSAPMIAADVAGNVYVSGRPEQDVPWNDSVIRKVTPDGKVSVIAGTGVPGYNGDSGPATAIQIANPKGIVTAADGSIYFVDSGNESIRKLTPHTVRVLNPASLQGGPFAAGSAVLVTSSDLGQIPVSALSATLTDSTGAKFTLVLSSAAGTQLTFIIPANVAVGTATLTVSGPNGVLATILVQIAVIAPALYSADGKGSGAASGMVIRVTAAADQITEPLAACSNNVCSTVPADTGPSTDESTLVLYGTGFRNRSSLGAVSLTIGNYQAPVLYAGPSSNDPAMDELRAKLSPALVGSGEVACLLRVDGITANSVKVNLGQAAWMMSFDSPRGAALDASGNLYFSDYGHQRVNRAGASGMFLGAAAGTGGTGYTGDNGQAIAATLRGPQSLAFDSQGSLFIADTANHVVRKISGGVITTVAGTGTQGFAGDGGQATSARLDLPSGIAVDANGALFICDSNNNRIRKVAPDGTITTIAGSAQGSKGDEGPALSAQLNHPSGIALGTDGSAYISEEFGNRVRQITPDGIIHAFAGNGDAGYGGDGGPAIAGSLSRPSGLAIGPDGTVYIADTGNATIRAVYTDGSINTIAGIGLAGYSGDGGPAAAASLSAPVALALDSATGTLYVADADNGRVRVITPDRNINTIAGNLAPVVYTDSTFNPGDYPETYSAGTNGATIVLDPNGSGMLVASLNFPTGNGSATYVALNQNWNYDPAKQGPVASIDISADLTCSRGTPGGQSWRAVISQAGNLYAGPSTGDANAAGSGQTYRFPATGFSARSFGLYTVNEAPDFTNNPDFTKPFSLGISTGFAPSSTTPQSFTLSFTAVSISVNRTAPQQ